MIRVTIEKLPGGDLARSSTIARFTLSNTAEGSADTRIYLAKLLEANAGTSAEVVHTTFKTHRLPGEGVLRLCHRALSRLLGDA